MRKKTPDDYKYTVYVVVFNYLKRVLYDEGFIMELNKDFWPEMQISDFKKMMVNKKDKLMVLYKKLLPYTNNNYRMINANN
jgi:hypothetical protein